MADSDGDDRPLENQTLLVPKHLLDHLEVLAAIDRGGTLTKIVYVSKNVPGENYELNLALFENKRFKNGLLWMQKEALLPENLEGKSLRVTGVGADKYRREIGDLLGLQVEFVDEFVTHNVGANFLISHFSDEEICHQDDLSKDAYTQFSLDNFKVSEKLAKTVKTTDTAEGNDRDRLPAVLAFCGSAFAMTKLQEDGGTPILGLMMQGGKPFLGLGKLLLNTSNYDEIMSLAEDGWRGNVDTQAKFLFQQGEGNYGQLPPELPLFSFGKAIDFDRSLSSFGRADLAHSLVNIWASALYCHVASAARIAECHNVYFGGNWVRSNAARRELRRIANMRKYARSLNLKFFKTGHTGAIGTMLSDPRKTKEMLS